MLDQSEVVYNINVIDINRAIEFYTNILGLKLEVRDEKGEWASLKAKNCSMWLSKNGGNKGIVFLVKNVEKIATYLRSKKVKVYVPDNYKNKGNVNEYGLETEYGKMIWFNDSEDNEIELFQMKMH